MRKILVIISLAFIFAAVAGIFWYTQFLYSLPTPVPANYVAVPVGKNIKLPQEITKNNSRPLLLHFFNPACPCSKFNMKYFRSLVKQYGNKTDFAVVVMSSNNYTAKDIQEKFGLDIPVSFDTAIAKTCGVYSTPQAVILDAEGKLYYRGNYNRSRYCTDKKTNYAEQALTGLLNNKSNPIFNQFALKAYGCKLPNCTK